MMLLLLFATTGAFFLLNYQIEKQILIDQIRQRALLMGKTLQVNLSRLILKSSQQDLASIPETRQRSKSILGRNVSTLPGRTVYTMRVYRSWLLTVATRGLLPHSREPTLPAMTRCSSGG